MSNTETIAALFQAGPKQWGLRGDPHLWNEMRGRFSDTPLPATADELSALIEAAFESLTGQPISTRDPFFIERLSHGGMSSGYVSPEFWRDKAIPFLLARYAEIG